MSNWWGWGEVGRLEGLEALEEEWAMRDSHTEKVKVREGGR